MSLLVGSTRLSGRSIGDGVRLMGIRFLGLPCPRSQISLSICTRSVDFPLPVSRVTARSMLSFVLRSRLPDIVSSPVLRDLIRSFSLSRPRPPLTAPSWDVNKVLAALRLAPFEPLESCEFRALSSKTIFLVALATAKRVGELQALSFNIASSGQDLVLSYLPEFVAKTESERNPLPRFFVVRSLEEFVGDLPEERLLCPVRALRIFLDRTSSLTPRPRSLFVSPGCPSRALSKNALSYFLRKTIVDSGAVSDGSTPRAHSIRGVATSALFMRNWSVSRVLEAATWKSNPVFASFYLRDVAFSLEGCSSLGPFVAAGGVIH